MMKVHVKRGRKGGRKGEGKRKMMVEGRKQEKEEDRRSKEEKEGEKRRMGKGEAGGEEKTREKNHHDTTLSMKSPIMVFVSQLQYMCNFHINTSLKTYPWQSPRSDKHNAIQVDSMNALSCRDNTVHPRESFLIRTVRSLLRNDHHSLFT